MAAENLQQQPLGQVIHGHGLPGSVPVAEREHLTGLGQHRVLTLVDLLETDMAWLPIPDLVDRLGDVQLAEVEMEEIERRLDAPAGDSAGAGAGGAAAAPEHPAACV